MLRLITPPTAGTLAVPLDVAKRHLNVDFADDDDLIAAYVGAATERVQQECRALIVLPSTWAADSDLWCDRMVLPLAPVVSVTSLSYWDAGNVQQTLAPSLYGVTIDSGGRGMVAPAYGQAWPATRGGANAVTIVFTAGFSAIPPAIQAAILLMVGGLYEQRADVTARAVFAVPDAVAALLAKYRVW